MASESVHRSEIPAWECYQLIKDHRTGRLGIIEHGYPIAIPVSYRLFDASSERRVVVRTAPNTTIAQYEGLASLEIDQIDEHDKTAWSVVARGVLHRVHDADSLPDPQPWLIEGRRQWMALDVVAVSGRRFVAQSTGDGMSVQWRFV